MPVPTVLTAAYAGFDMDIPGYEFRRLKNFTDEELWDAFVKEVDE